MSTIHGLLSVVSFVLAFSGALAAAPAASSATGASPTTMKAVLIHAHDGPEGLVYEYDDAPRPAAAPGEVLIRVHAAGVNPVDWKILRGALRDPDRPHPYITGFDVAGVVESRGEGVDRFQPGDEVYLYQELGRGGAYAEYMTADQQHVARMPRGLTFVEAAAVPLAALTAWQALFENADLQPGQTILIHGAAGGVGHFAVQLAKAKGAHIIGTASERNHEYLRSIGVDEVIDYRSVRFEDVVRDVDVVLDTVGGDTLHRSYAVAKEGGIVVTIAGQPSPEAAAARGVRAAWFLARPNAAQLDELSELVAEGGLRPTISEVLPLAEARKAHEMSQTGRTRGKIVLRVRDD